LFGSKHVGFKTQNGVKVELQRIAMNDAFLARRLERFCHLLRDREALVDGKVGFGDASSLPGRRGPHLLPIFRIERLGVSEHSVTWDLVPCRHLIDEWVLFG
jgi:hypothetical protein